MDSSQQAKPGDGDDELQKAIEASLDAPGDRAARLARAEDYSVERATAVYAALLDPGLI